MEEMNNENMKGTVAERFKALNWEKIDENHKIPGSPAP